MKKELQSYSYNGYYYDYHENAYYIEMIVQAVSIDQAFMRFLYKVYKINGYTLGEDVIRFYIDRESIALISNDEEDESLMLPLSRINEYGETELLKDGGFYETVEADYWN